MKCSKCGNVHSRKNGSWIIGLDLGYQEMAQRRVKNNQKAMFA